nr:aldo/keto reductase [Kitasatospora mediocidica]
MTSDNTPESFIASASGTWKPGSLSVNRIGFGAMRLPQHGPAFVPDAAPSGRARAIAVLRRAVEIGVNHIDTAAFYFSALRSANELINQALWTLHQGPHVLAIPDTGDLGHLVENVAAGDLRPSTGELAALDSLHRSAA